MIQAAAHIELNINALRHNVRKVRELAPKSNLMAVIKANAYGHGLICVANSLTDVVDALAVARIDEGIRIREAGVQGRILVLQGFSQLDELELLQRYQLESVIHTEQQLSILESAMLQRAISIWIKIDTGMNRLGIRPEQFSVVLQRLQQCSGVQPEINFMTHFANADDIQGDKTTRQLQLFNEVTKLNVGQRSSANSAAIIAWPETRQDWIRPGLMLYGASPLLQQTAQQLMLLPVMSLYSQVIALKQVKKGEAVGYGGSWVADKDTSLGVVSIGYGDGYPRYAKQGTPVLINNKRVPLVGRVSMDMITVDLTEHTDIQVGDQVLLWGDGLPVEEIAAGAETIPYTLLCGITRRVQVMVKD
ncbi:alanine racemase [Bathymodiolus platifrons methanotrophic gill symbiont]|uniref:alanine racemase n=1 Tax=Bathymodiolus platifrons methanotrophic gill symbiont TaxID=113268 RepID=UPI000B65ACD8|nr:alanine racemase [Bathymodiolus platifrons methanotrophic gill symbiont]GAW85660.1 alanine racemase [Bathymodiolus platifrons methanotrophic gill symbiont]GFO75499.1 alanine racemase [Bathymodiolus platifrons methanotrophic gill symbiont]